LAAEFADSLTKADDFEIAVKPDCNIVCFRYVPEGVEDDALDMLQSSIRQTLLDEGDFYIVQTRLRGTLYLRVTLINPLTEKNDLDVLMKSIRRIGKAV